MLRPSKKRLSGSRRVRYISGLESLSKEIETIHSKVMASRLKYGALGSFPQKPAYCVPPSCSLLATKNVIHFDIYSPKIIQEASRVARGMEEHMPRCACREQ